MTDRIVDMETPEFKTLDEVVDHILKNMTAESKHFIENCAKADRYDLFEGEFIFPETERIDHKLGERIFTGNTHHGFGTGIRNNLNLWWTPDLAKEYPDWTQEKPALIAWFESVGLDGSFGVVGDDRSALLIRAVYRKYHNLDLDVAGYVAYLKNFYKAK